MSNKSQELPSHDELPRYAWADRAQFAALTRSLGGSSDTHGADLCSTDRPGNHGRYPRQYTASGLASDGGPLPADIDGQTMSFLATTLRRSEAAPRGVVALIGAPWATQAERDATYAWLAREAHVRCNDVTTEERALIAPGPEYAVQRTTPPSAAEFARGARGDWTTISTHPTMGEAADEVRRLRRQERGESSYRAVTVHEPRK